MKKSYKRALQVVLMVFTLLVSIAIGYFVITQNNAPDDSSAVNTYGYMRCGDSTTFKYFNEFENSATDIPYFQFWGENPGFETVKTFDYNNDANKELQLVLNTNASLLWGQSDHVMINDYRVLLNIEKFEPSVAGSTKYLAGIYGGVPGQPTLIKYTVSKNDAGLELKLSIFDDNGTLVNNFTKQLPPNNKSLILGLEKLGGRFNFVYLSPSSSPANSSNIIKTIVNNGAQTTLESYGFTSFNKGIIIRRNMQFGPVYTNEGPNKLSSSGFFDDFGQVYCQNPTSPTPTPTLPPGTCNIDADCNSGQVCNDSNLCIPDPIPSQPIRMMTIHYNPRDPNTLETAADKYFSSFYEGKTAQVYANQKFNEIKAILNSVSNNTYQYEIVKNITINQFPLVNGVRFDINTYSKCVPGHANFDRIFCEEYKGQFNYNDWEARYNICNLIEENDIDLVLMYSLPHIMATESFVFGPTMDINTNGGVYLVPDCKRHVTFIDGVYDTPHLLLHSFGHHLETALLQMATNMKETDADKYLNNFMEFDLENQNKIRCGNVHYPFNTTDDYTYDSLAFKQNNCQTWGQFPNVEPNVHSQPLNCTAWNCKQVSEAGGEWNDEHWQEYWMKYIPSGSGSTNLTSISNKPFAVNNNWWSYIIESDNLIRLKRDADF